MFHFNQRKRTDNMKLTQNKAQMSVLLDKIGFDLHPHTKKRNSRKVEKDTKWGRSISCSCWFFPKWTDLWLSLTFCLVWSSTCSHLEAMFRYKALKPCRNEIISEIIWGGRIQTDVEDKGLPSQPKEIIYWKKLSSQWILQNQTATESHKRSKWSRKPGCACGLDLQGRNFSFYLKTELNFSNNLQKLFYQLRLKTWVR